MNAADPRFVPAIFNGRFDAGATYIDMAMSLSRAAPGRAIRGVGKKLGDDQFAVPTCGRARAAGARRDAASSPASADVFARYAADQLFREIDEIGVRDGANLVIDGHAFAPTFSIWTTIEECLNPPVDLGEGTAAGSPPSRSASPETFAFPDGIGTSSA